MPTDPSRPARPSRTSLAIEGSSFRASSAGRERGPRFPGALLGRPRGGQAPTALRIPRLVSGNPRARGSRIHAAFQRRGRLPRERDSFGHDHASESELLAQIRAASVQGSGALAPQSPPPMTRVGRPFECNPPHMGRASPAGFRGRRSRMSSMRRKAQVDRADQRRPCLAQDPMAISVCRASLQDSEPHTSTRNSPSTCGPRHSRRSCAWMSYPPRS